MFSIAYLNSLRRAEIDRVVGLLKPGARILEIGAGTGEQALDLQGRGFDVTAIELANSSYARDRRFPIIDYDGRHIPLPDHSVDIVFSSSVMEHVPDLPQMHGEIRRVLKPSGYCVHLLPTHTWRMWTTLTAVPDAIVYLVVALAELVPRGLPRGAELRRAGRAAYRKAQYVGWRIWQRRHGVRGNVVSEHWLFRPSWWRRNFQDNGFAIRRDQPMGLFYTGNNLFGPHLSFALRERMARVLGSACHLFETVPVASADHNRLTDEQPEVAEQEEA